MSETESEISRRVQALVEPGAAPRVLPPRLTMRAFFAEAADELLSAHRGLPYTFLMLFRRPAAVVREFIVWRSARVTRPLRYFLIVVLLVNAVAAIGGREAERAARPATTEARVADAPKPGSEAYARGRTAGSRIGAAVRWLREGHVEWLLLLTVPFLAIACRHEFREHGYNLAEHWVLALYGVAQAYWFVGGWSLLAARGLDVPAWCVLGLAPLVFGWICSDVFGGSRASGIARGLYALALSVITLFVALVLVAALAMLL